MYTIVHFYFQVSQIILVGLGSFCEKYLKELASPTWQAKKIKEGIRKLREKLSS